MKQRLLFYGILLALPVAFGWYATAMPDSSHHGPLPPATAEIDATAAELRGHVLTLANAIGERRVGQEDSLNRARDYLMQTLVKLEVASGTQPKTESLGSEGGGAENVFLELPGTGHDLVVVGAHYDSAPGTPGANDNATGVAATLVLARKLAGKRLARTLRFVLFANEEPPYFQQPGMGSLTHARGCRARGENIHAMLALESLGLYSDAPESQHYPWPVGLFYPSAGNFVGFVGNLGSRSLVREAVATFRRSAAFPSEGAALPASIPGVGWSDHWSFWQVGYPALMITDTATYRDPHYHQGSDVPANLDFEKLARVTLGLERVLTRLAE